MESVFPKVAEENVCVVDEIETVEVELFFEDLVYLRHLSIGSRVVLVISTKH